MRSKPSPLLEVGVAAPRFELKDAGGQNQQLESLLADSPVLLAFFKSSCPVCQLTFPFLERLSANQPVRIVGVSQDDASVTKTFSQRFGITFPLLLDEARAGFPVSNAFGIQSVPSIFLIEQNGTISSAFTGFSKHDLELVGERVGIAPFHPDEKVPVFRPG